MSRLCLFRCTALHSADNLRKPQPFDHSQRIITMPWQALSITHVWNPKQLQEYRMSRGMTMRELVGWYHGPANCARNAVEQRTVDSNR